VAVVVDEEFVSDPLGCDHVSLRAEWTKADNLADHTILRDFDWSESTRVIAERPRSTGC
jgi:hypothetical protein